MGSGMLACASLIILLSNWVSPWWCGLLQNVGAGIVTSLLLIFLYDRIMERRVEDEAQARRKVAMSKLRSILRRHISGALFEIYYGGAKEKPARDLSYLELLQGNFVDVALRVDMMALSMAAYPSKVEVGTFIARSFSKFSVAIDSWLAAYVGFVDGVIASKVEQLSQNNYLGAASDFERVVRAMENLPEYKGIGVPIGNGEFLREYIDSLIAVVCAVEGESLETLGNFQSSIWDRPYAKVGYAAMREAG